MKARLFFAALACASFAVAADTTKLEVTVSDVPANATELILIVDAGVAAGPGYEDLNAPPAAAAAVQQVIQQVQPAAATPAAAPANPAAAAAAAPADAQQQRRRRTAGPQLPPPTRQAVAVNGRSSVKVEATVPLLPNLNYQARVVALADKGALPSVLAGGQVGGLKLAANETKPVQISLKNPGLKLAPANPATVAPGAAYKLAGTLTDPSRALGAKTRMRVWISEGTPPTANYAGVQTSTVDVTNTDGELAFTFELTAPNRPTKLYYQFGELPAEFARADGKQAPFVVVPDLSAGGKPLELQVK